MNPQSYDTRARRAIAEIQGLCRIWKFESNEYGGHAVATERFLCKFDGMNFWRFTLLFLFLTGCASHQVRPPGTGIQDSEHTEERHFFYGGWFPQKGTPEDREDRLFFYDSWMNGQ